MRELIDEKPYATLRVHRRERLYGREVCLIATGQQHRSFGLLPSGDRLLCGSMQARVPADEPRRCAAGALRQGVLHRQANRWVVRQSEIVVRGKVREDAITHTNMCGINWMGLNTLAKLVLLSPAS